MHARRDLTGPIEATRREGDAFSSEKTIYIVSTNGLILILSASRKEIYIYIYIYMFSLLSPSTCYPCYRASHSSSIDLQDPLRQKISRPGSIHHDILPGARGGLLLPSRPGIGYRCLRFVAVEKMNPHRLGLLRGHGGQQRAGLDLHLRGQPSEARQATATSAARVARRGVRPVRKPRRRRRRSLHAEEPLPRSSLDTPASDLR